MIKPNDYVERVEEMLNANFVDENVLQPYPELPEASWTATGKTPPRPPRP